MDLGLRGLGCSGLQASSGGIGVRGHRVQGLYRLRGARLKLGAKGTLQLDLDQVQGGRELRLR